MKRKTKKLSITSYVPSILPQANMETFNHSHLLQFNKIADK